MRLVARTIAALLTVCLPCVLLAQSETAPLVLQEMTWVDVRDYLKANDMVIIPLGSTEQHGPHLPLGSDFYQAVETAKLISRETGVIVAPVLTVGYSLYHTGFPGTLTLREETMEDVLFETAEALMKYGFRRFLFFNSHGGNKTVERNVVHRINHSTEAVAVSIGIGNPFGEPDSSEFFDWHAGKSETSAMLYLMPALVHLEAAEKPILTFSPRVRRLLELSEKDPSLLHVWDILLTVPEETKKQGATHEISNNGILSYADPRTATPELGRREVQRSLDPAVKFIKAWKAAEN